LRFDPSGRGPLDADRYAPDPDEPPFDGPLFAGPDFGGPDLSDPDLDEAGRDELDLPDPEVDVARYEPLAGFFEPPGRPLDEREEEDGRSFDMADHATPGWTRHA